MAVAKFTPSLLPPERLEELFVGREGMLADAIDRIEDAAATGRRSHLLLTGPRGSGKTHLISLIYHRASRLPGYGSDFRLAWLEEDPWLIASIADLYQAVEAAAEPPKAAGGPESPFTIVFAENLDWILDAIGPQGQRSLRARLERDRDLLFLASATRLTSYLLDQAQPFYGFFEVQTLDPFTTDEAVEMLVRLARAGGEPDLAKRLESPGIRSRVAAVQHLTGGQPRIWATLSPGLSLDGLDDLADTLLEALDDLTPYYQEQMARLSPLERRVVKVLADAGHAMTVSAIARGARAAPRSISRAVGDLKHAHWLTPHRGPLMAVVDKRQTYYELAEPMARLAFELKATRGRELPVLIELLALWFDESDLGLPGPSDEGWPEPATYGYREHVAVRRARSDFYAAKVLSLPDLLTAWPESSELDGLIDRLDDALAALTHLSDASALLEQPVVLLDIVERKLETHTVGDVRAELLAKTFRPERSALSIDTAPFDRDASREVRRAVELLPRLLDCLSGVSAGRALRTRLEAATLRLWAARESGAASLHDLVGDASQSFSVADWLWLATRLPPDLTKVETGLLLRLAQGSWADETINQGLLPAMQALGNRLGVLGDVDGAARLFSSLREDLDRVIGGVAQAARWCEGPAWTICQFAAAGQVRTGFSMHLGFPRAADIATISACCNEANWLLCSGKPDLAHKALSRAADLLDDQLMALIPEAQLAVGANLVEVLRRNGQDGEATSLLNTLRRSDPPLGTAWDDSWLAAM